MKKNSFKALITAAAVASTFLGLPGCGGKAQDSSRNDYKGQKDFDYREGYDDGYEAGYYDNLSRE